MQPVDREGDDQFDKLAINRFYQLSRPTPHNRRPIAQILNSIFFYSDLLWICCTTGTFTPRRQQVHTKSTKKSITHPQQIELMRCDEVMCCDDCAVHGEVFSSPVFGTNKVPEGTIVTVLYLYTK